MLEFKRDHKSTIDVDKKEIHKTCKIKAEIAQKAKTKNT